MRSRILRRWWVCATLLLIGVTAGCAISSAPPPQASAAEQQAATAFVAQGDGLQRGRILAVLTSTPRFGPKQKNAGYELTELSRAYYVFRANGFAVDFASPKGGLPPVKIDQDDLGAIDHAFINDSQIQQRIATSLPLADIDPARYAAVYFVGGKGAMFDFPQNPDAQRMVKYMHRHGVIGAVCHGPAALLEVKGDDGSFLVRNRHVTGFTNDEELFLIPNARQVFPYLLQDRALAHGARFSEVPRYTRHVIVDDRLVTGQNPWSTWAVAEEMVRALGSVPVPRPVTAEEKSLDILAAYHRDGLDAALTLRAARAGFEPSLVRLHALIAAMEWRLIESMKLLRLAGV